MDNFDLKKFLTESKMTRNSRLLSENQDNFSDGKFRISHAGVPVNKIVVSVESPGVNDGDASFEIEFDENGKATIVNFFNYSEEIDDDEVKSYMESMLAKGALKNLPEFISFNPETGKPDDSYV